MNDKNVNIKTLRKQCRLSTIMLDAQDEEKLKAAYLGGFTHAKLNNNISRAVVSHNVTDMFPRIKGVYPYEK